jgi:hypothetical protein
MSFRFIQLGFYIPRMDDSTNSHGIVNVVATLMLTLPS